MRIPQLEERLSRLSRASLGITGDLDVGGALQGVVDGARLITAASRGCITHRPWPDLWNVLSDN